MRFWQGLFAQCGCKSVLAIAQYSAQPSISPPYGTAKMLHNNTERIWVALLCGSCCFLDEYIYNHMTSCDSVLHTPNHCSFFLGLQPLDWLAAILHSDLLSSFLFNSSYIPQSMSSMICFIHYTLYLPFRFLLHFILY